MKKVGRIAMIAPCGIDCGDCGANKVKDNPALMDSLIAVGFKKEGLPCAGCRSLKGNCSVIGSTCETYAFECPEFPCAKLNPASDRANVLPHNMKVFNLCFIQRQGLDKFLERGPEIKQRYYRGIMEIGKGPQLK